MPGQFLSADALAAVGTTRPLSFLILGFVMGMTGGFSVLVAQRFGAGDYKEMRRHRGDRAPCSALYSAFS
ncbi:MAG: MATE family efflux transporter [Oscillospiraceae bacterium]